MALTNAEPLQKHKKSAIKRFCEQLSFQSRAKYEICTIFCFDIPTLIRQNSPWVPRVNRSLITDSEFINSENYTEICVGNSGSR